jgi:hypothetical protein
MAASSPARDDVRWIPTEPSTALTASQRDRVARADTGDFDARLEAIPFAVVETELARRTAIDGEGQSGRSILNYLRQPPEGISRCQAAISILEQTGDKLEQGGIDAVLVYRYIQELGLWKDHPNRQVRSASDLVSALNSRGSVQVGLIVGASTLHAKRQRIEVIDRKWGPDWFRGFPKTLLSPATVHVYDFSLGILTEIAATAERGKTFDEAAQAWAAAMEERTDPARRKATNRKGPAAKSLQRSDFSSVNVVLDEELQGGRTVDVFLPLSVTEDTLDIRLAPPAGTESGRPLPASNAGRRAGKVRRTGAGQDVGGPRRGPPRVHVPGAGRDRLDEEGEEGAEGAEEPAMTVGADCQRDQVYQTLRELEVHIGTVIAGLDEALEAGKEGDCTNCNTALRRVVGQLSAAGKRVARARAAADDILCLSGVEDRTSP